MPQVDSASQISVRRPVTVGAVRVMFIFVVVVEAIPKFNAPPLIVQWGGVASARLFDLFSQVVCGE